MDDQISEERIKTAIAKRFGMEASQLGEEVRFVEELGADSIDTVELMMALEEQFSISIPSEVAEKLTTSREVIKYIKSRKNSP